MRRLWFAGALLAASAALAHETLTTTVLFDREIVRILDKHCVACHADGGPSFPLETYEQAWVQGRKMRAVAIARHMPPWAAVPGYGQFANDNSLTLRESQFLISWVEGLGPRNAGTVFTNIVDPGAPKPKEVRANLDFKHWKIAEPTNLQYEVAAALPAGSGVQRAVVDLGLKGPTKITALEYMPTSRRAVHAVAFTLEQTGQWLGSWTPWYGYASLPKGAALSLPAGARIVAEIHYADAKAGESERGALRLFSSTAPTDSVSELRLEAAAATGPGSVRQATTKLAAATRVVSLWPEFGKGTKSIEVSARKPNGQVDVLLFVRDPPEEWPTPYILKTPAALPAGTELKLVAHGDSSVRLIASVIAAAR